MFDIDIYSLVATLGVAFMLSLLLTPLFRDLAGYVGLVDSPDGRRKHQLRPVPRAGGLAIFVAAIASILCLTQFGLDLFEFIHSEPKFVNLLGACAIIAVVGLLDDFIGLRGRHKLLGQFIAVTFLIYYSHLSIQHFSMFGVQIDLGPFGIAMTYLWMIGIINAINLIDGMDGLLGIIGALVCLALAVVAALIGDAYIAIVSVALAGALLGFLCFNLPPASVYLGDCGSMLIGLVVGALSIQDTSIKYPTAMTLAVPISVLILPILDTTAAITRRKLTGRSIYTTDRGHLHHCLLRTGMNRPVVLGLVTVLGLIAASGAVATTVLHSDLYSLAAAAIVVITLVATGLFGHAEYTLLKKKLRALVAQNWNGSRVGRSHQLQVRLQGSVRWQGIWEELTTAAFQYDFRMLCLDVNAPAMHEGYHARWDRFGAKHSDEESHDWRADLPICLDGQIIGRLTAVGVCDLEPVWVKLQQLGAIVQVTEQHIYRLIELHSIRSVPASPVFADALGTAS